MTNKKSLKTLADELVTKGWIVVDGCAEQILVADKFGPGCRVGAFVDADGMDVFYAGEGGQYTQTRTYVYMKDVTTLPDPRAAYDMLDFKN